MHLLAAIDYNLFRFGPFEIFKKIPILQDIDFLSNIAIHSFGLFVAIGLMTTFNLSAKRGEEKLGIDGEEVQNFGLYLVAIGWFFAHFFNILFYEPHRIADDPLILFKVWGSISSYGGMFGGIIAAYIWKVRNPDKDFLSWVELGVWGLTFSWMFGRIGCASVHDHPGAPTDFFLAVSGWPDGMTRHDLGLYEAIWWVVIVITILILDRKPRPKGFFIAVVPLMYAPARFFLDFLRVGPEQGGDIRYFGLTPAQYFSMLIFGIGLYFLKRMWNNPPIVWKKFVYEGASSTASSGSQDTAKDDEAIDADDVDESASDQPDEQSQPKRKRGAGPKKKKKK